MIERFYFVYIMSNRKGGVIYVGVTSDLATRVLQHRTGDTDGFTKRYNCRRLVWFEGFDDVRDAIDREKRLKRWLRAWKIELIEARNPDWKDLWPALMGQERFPWETEADFLAPGDPGTLTWMRKD